MNPGYSGPFCKGKSRQHGGPCGLPPIPFGDFCRFHGGNRKQHREVARKRMLEYERWSTDPIWLKRLRLRQWQEAEDRWEMRKAKKAGPEAVAALKRERAAWKADRQREFAENRRLREQKRAEYRQQKNAPPSSTPYGGGYYDDGFNDGPRAFDYDMGWEV